MRVLRVGAFVVVALLASADSVAHEPPKSMGETVVVGDRFFHTVSAQIGEDGVLTYDCGVIDSH